MPDPAVYKKLAEATSEEEVMSVLTDTGYELAEAPGGMGEAPIETPEDLEASDEPAEEGGEDMKMSAIRGAMGKHSKKAPKFGDEDDKDEGNPFA